MTFTLTAKPVQQPLLRTEASTKPAPIVVDRRQQELYDSGLCGNPDVAGNATIGERLRKLCETWHVQIGVDSARSGDDATHGAVSYVYVVILRAVDGRPGAHVYRRATLDTAIGAAWSDHHG